MQLTPEQIEAELIAALDAAEEARVAAELAHYDEMNRGLGDTIFKVTQTLRIPHCGGCEERREKLNAAVPYRKKERLDG